MKCWQPINALLRSVGIVAILLCTSLPYLVVAQSIEGNSTAGEEDVYIYSISYDLEQPIGGESSVESLGQYVNIIYQFALGMVGIMAVVLIMFGGIRWISAAGNEQTIGDAKEIIVSAVIGLVIALLSYSILVFINPRFLNLDLAVFQIPLQSSAGSFICPNSETITEDSGGKICNGNAEGSFTKPSNYAGTTIDSATLNGWLTKYNSGADVTFIKAIMQQESSFCINANSAATFAAQGRGENIGACGIGQMMPSTAKQYAGTCGLSACSGVPSTGDIDADNDKSNSAVIACCQQLLDDPEKAVCASVTMINGLFSNTYTKGSSELVAAAYNGGTCSSSGSGALCESGECPGKLAYQCEANTGYAQTRDYVEKVSAFHKAMCSENADPTKCVYTSSFGSLTQAANYYCTTGTLYTGALCSSDGVGSCLDPGDGIEWKLIGGCDSGKEYHFSESSRVSSDGFIYTSAPACEDPIAP